MNFKFHNSLIVSNQFRISESFPLSYLRIVKLLKDGCRGDQIEMSILLPSVSQHLSPHPTCIYGSPQKGCEENCQKQGFCVHMPEWM